MVQSQDAYRRGSIAQRRSRVVVGRDRLSAEDVGECTFVPKRIIWKNKGRGEGMETILSPKAPQECATPSRCQVLHW